jgi:hypothetical protein
VESASAKQKAETQAIQQQMRQRQEIEDLRREIRDLREQQ